MGLFRLSVAFLQWVQSVRFYYSLQALQLLGRVQLVLGIELVEGGSGGPRVLAQYPELPVLVDQDIIGAHVSYF